MKQKRIWFCALWLSVFFFCAVPVQGEMYTYSGADTAQWDTAWETLLETLPEDIRAEANDYTLSAGEDAEKNLQKILSFSYWWEKLLPYLKRALEEVLQTLTTVFSVLLLSAVLRQWAGGAVCTSAFDFCRDTCLALALLTSMLQLISRMQSLLERLCGMMTAMIPVMSAIHLGSGETTTGSVNRIALTLFITVLSQFQRCLFLPLGQALCSLSIMSGVCTQISFSGFTAALKKLFQSLFSILVIVYSFVYGLQNSLARTADSLGMRTIRFAMGNLIPIVGSTVGEAFSALRAGMGYVKLMAGAGGIWLLCLIVLPTALTIWVFDIMLACSHTAAELLDIGQSARLLGDVRSVLQMLAAVIWLAVIFFLFAIILFTKSTGQVA